MTSRLPASMVRGARRLATLGGTTLGVVIAGLAAVSALPAQAPSLSTVAPAGMPINAYAERAFDLASGLGSTTVFDLAIDADGTPWIATEDGVYQFTGSRWRRDSLPGFGSQQSVRAVLVARDGSLWMATRRGIVRRSRDGALQRFDAAEGVAGTRAFSLIETRAIDGTWRIVAGLYGGVVYFDRDRFVPLPNAGIPSPRGVMVAEAPGRDGSPELWMADAASGVARFRGGRWDTFGPTEGLDVQNAEYVIGSTAPGAPAVLVAGTRGVYALDRRGPVDRFVRVPGTPERATRVALVRGTDGVAEVWVGTQTGQLRRLRNRQWQDVVSRVADRRGAVLLLRALSNHGPGQTVYASTRAGSLVRIALGMAATMPLGGAATGAVYAERDRSGRDALWWTGAEHTVTQVRGDGTVRTVQVPPVLGEPRVFPLHIGRYIVAPPRPAPMASSVRDTGVIIAVLGGEPWQIGARGAVAMRDGLGMARVHQLLRTTSFDGVDRLLAATPFGLFSWGGRQWDRLPLTGAGVRPQMQFRAIAVDSSGPRERLLLGSNRGVVVIDDRGARLEVPTIPGARDSLIRVLRLCVAPTRGSASRYFALVQEEGIFTRLTSESVWSPLPAQVTRVTPIATAVDMVCVDSGRVAIGFSNGVMLVDAAEPDTAQWQVRAQLSDADGLPASPVTKLAASGTPDALWVGTAAGLALVDLHQASLRQRPTLRLSLTSQQTGTAFADGAVLSPGDDDVQVDAALLTFHREEATRYRVRLRATSWTATTDDAAVTDAEREWLPSPTRNFLDLAPGSYELLAWAYDWTGQEYGPVRHRFTVSAPVWRQWPALVIYVVILLSVGVLAYRWRRGTLEGAEAQRRESERQVAAERAFFEEQIREAQKLESLGTLAGGVAHDFNNLLGVIRGNAELARSAIRKGRNSDDNLGAILDASDRARNIVRQILTFSRRSTPTRDYVNLSMLVRDLQPLLRRMVPRSVQLVFEGLDDLAVIRGDATQLQQLLLNLVSNAEHAVRGRERQVVTIALDARVVSAQAPPPTGDVIVLRVSDTGAGMSPEVRGRLFEPFFTTKPIGEGTGLGMAVVHGIVVSHEARAEVASEEGQGTIFEILFPRAAMDALFDEGLEPWVPDEVGRRPTPAHGAPATTGSTLVVAGSAPDRERSRESEDSVDDGVPDPISAAIVVVDDEPAVAQVVAEALAQVGHAVQVFTNPEVAVAAMRASPDALDLLITDLTMPGLTGDQVAAAVHAIRPELPVLLLTGFSDRLTAERAAQVGIHRVLDKPVELAVLQGAVEAVLTPVASGERGETGR